MNAIDYLRSEIKSSFPGSSELQLSNAYAQHRRFNFYFRIKDSCPFLLYLNWDGEYDRFTLKCLEFHNAETLDQLMADYPEKGAKTFNLGQPRRTVSFVCSGANQLSVLEFRGDSQADFNSSNISAGKLMDYVDPGK